MAGQEIDRDKLRAAIRKLGDEYVFYMLDEAIDLLPEAKLLRLVSATSIRRDFDQMAMPRVACSPT